MMLMMMRRRVADAGGDESKSGWQRTVS